MNGFGRRQALLLTAFLAGLLGLFGLLAGNIGDVNWQTRFDKWLAAELHTRALGSPAGSGFFLYLTELGTTTAITVLAVIVGLVLLARRQFLLLAAWALTLSLGGLLDWGLKVYYRRPRPEFETRIVVEESWSFPSGHAMGSTFTFGMLAYLLVLVLPTRRARRAAVAALTLLILLICFSRLYLGAHYFSDVVGGLALGVVWLALCVAATEALRRRRLAAANRS